MYGSESTGQLLVNADNKQDDDNDDDCGDNDVDMYLVLDLANKIVLFEDLDAKYQVQS